MMEVESMKKLAVVDFDGTLFPGNSMPFIWKQYRKLGGSKLRNVTTAVKVMWSQYYHRKLRKDEAMWRYMATVHMFNLFHGMKDTEIRQFFESIVDTVYDELNPQVLKRIERHREDGYEIVLLSGGFEMLMDLIGRRIGATKVKATPFYYGLDGRLPKVTGKEKLVTMNGAKKGPYLEYAYKNQEVNWAGSYAYADNITDSDMMKMVGNPVAVNPDDALKACCEELHWAVL